MIALGQRQTYFKQEVQNAGLNQGGKESVNRVARFHHALRRSGGLSASEQQAAATKGGRTVCK